MIRPDIDVLRSALDSEEFGRGHPSTGWETYEKKTVAPGRYLWGNILGLNHNNVYVKTSLPRIKVGIFYEAIRSEVYDYMELLLLTGGPAWVKFTKQCEAGTPIVMSHYPGRVFPVVNIERNMPLIIGSAMEDVRNLDLFHLVWIGNTYHGKCGKTYILEVEI
jgi:hypothetical protein